MVKQAELQPLIVGELHRTCRADTQSVGQSTPRRVGGVSQAKLTDASAHVRHLEAAGHGRQEVQDQLEVAPPDAGRTVDEEPDVHRVVAGFT